MSGPRWTREGGFRWRWLARLTNGRVGLGRWTQAEVDRHRAAAKEAAEIWEWIVETRDE